LKKQKQLLESAQKTSSKRESFFNMMISSAMDHVVVLFKSHLFGLNMKLLHQYFIVDDAKFETLVSSAFDDAQDFISPYDSASLAEYDDNDSSKVL
jgi:translation elongation factor EF-Ts